jgi:hypothetical protein
VGKAAGAFSALGPDGHRIAGPLPDGQWPTRGAAVAAIRAADVAVMSPVTPTGDDLSQAWLAAAQDPQRVIDQESAVESVVESRSVFAEVWECMQRCLVCDQCW